jgi:hypothetical protein
VRLYSRPGNDFTRRFPLIVDALAILAKARPGIRLNEHIKATARPSSHMPADGARRHCLKAQGLDFIVYDVNVQFPKFSAVTL